MINRIVFISTFLFYCLLFNHSFPTNPNRITNCYKLILFYLQLYNLHLLNAFAILIFEGLPFGRDEFNQLPIQWRVLRLNVELLPWNVIEKVLATYTTNCTKHMAGKYFKSEERACIAYMEKHCRLTFLKFESVYCVTVIEL